MKIHIETPRLNVDLPKAPSWLSLGAIQYFEAALEDLHALDPQLKYEDSQRLVQRIWHVVDSAKKTIRTIDVDLESIHRNVKVKFDKLPENVLKHSQVPIETTLELLVRTLAQKVQPKSLHDYRRKLNDNLPNLIRTVEKLKLEQNVEGSCIPKVLFVCIGPHMQSSDPIHVITTTRERYSATQNKNGLEKWSKDTFKDRLYRNNEVNFEELGKTSSAFYKMVLPEGWNNFPSPEFESVFNLAKSQAAASPKGLTAKEWATLLLESNHKANATAAWVSQSNTNSLVESKVVFDHSIETAVAFGIGYKPDGLGFRFRARCFRCRGMFCYRQIPDATNIEADFPKCWTDQVYHMGCAEIPGHFHCVAAREAGQAIPSIKNTIWG